MPASGGFLKFIPDPTTEELFKTDLALLPKLSPCLNPAFLVLEKFDPALEGVRHIVNLLIGVLENPKFALELLEEFNLEREAEKLEVASALMTHLAPHGSAVGVPQPIKACKDALLMTMCEGPALS